MPLPAYLWSLALANTLGAFVRTSGKLNRHERHARAHQAAIIRHHFGPVSQLREPVVAGAHGMPPEAPGLHRGKRKATMSFDIVGDDDMGAIGYEDIIGDDDEAFLDELISGDELEDLISGDGSSEIIGAARRSRRSGRAKAALRKIAMRNSGAVVKRGLDRRRRYPLGFVPTSIAASTTSQIPSAPQNLYRPERLVIPSDIAFDIGIGDIKVGNQSQLVQSVEVPAALFSEVAINTGVTFDTAEVGNQVSVTARNKSGVALEFTAGLVGTIAK